MYFFLSSFFHVGTEIIIGILGKSIFYYY